MERGSRFAAFTSPLSNLFSRSRNELAAAYRVEPEPKSVLAVRRDSRRHRSARVHHWLQSAPKRRLHDC
jgi:hypothetical protein